MGIRYEDLEEMCETLSGKISEANDKIRQTSGDLTGGDLEYIDRLTHALKSIKTIMAMEDGGNSYGSYGNSYGNGSYSGNGGYSSRYYPGNSSRGRRRDSMGRYSRRGYSRGDDNGEVIEQLQEAMEMAPDEKTRQDIQKIITKMES